MINKMWRWASPGW